MINVPIRGIGGGHGGQAGGDRQERRDITLLEAARDCAANGEFPEEGLPGLGAICVHDGWLDRRKGRAQTFRIREKGFGALGVPDGPGNG